MAYDNLVRISYVDDRTGFY